jgi:hypothetical protein
MHFFDVGREPDPRELPNPFSNSEHKLYSGGLCSTTTGTAVAFTVLVRDFCFRRHRIMEKWEFMGQECQLDVERKFRSRRQETHRRFRQDVDTFALIPESLHQ